jgi:hypothetical protein
VLLLVIVDAQRFSGEITSTDSLLCSSNDRKNQARGFFWGVSMFQTAKPYQSSPNLTLKLAEVGALELKMKAFPTTSF